MLEITPIYAFEDNYIWLLSQPNSSKVTVVDPGDEAPVLRRLEQEGWVLESILITHHHGDHVGGVAALQEHFPEVRVYGPAQERIPCITDLLQAGDTIDCLGVSFDILETPGHTAGHIMYYSADAGVLFCGDTVFAGGCGRLFEGTPQQMQHSLSQVMALPKDTLLYCAHEYTTSNLAFAKWVEPENVALLEREVLAKELRSRQQPTVPSSLELELATNPFLRFEQATVIKAAEQFKQHALENPAEIFAAIREWKDTKFD